MDKDVDNRKRARALGRYLRDRREHLGLSARAVARAVGVQDSTVMRLERGTYLAPAPDKLARMAGVLELDLADVYTLVGYVVPDSLPGFAEYLTMRYPALSESAVGELEAHLQRLVGIPEMQGAVR